MSEPRRAQIGYKPDGSPRDADRQDRYREVGVAGLRPCPPSCFSGGAIPLSNALHHDGKVRRGWFKFMLERVVWIRLGRDESGMVWVIGENERRCANFYKY